MQAYLEDGKLFAPVTFEAPVALGDVWLEVPPDDPEYDMWLADAKQLEPWAEVAAGWDESLHPRHPQGDPEGGQFAEKTTGDLPPGYGLRDRRPLAKSTANRFNTAWNKMLRDLWEGGGHGWQRWGSGHTSSGITNALNDRKMIDIAEAKGQPLLFRIRPEGVGQLEDWYPTWRRDMEIPDAPEGSPDFVPMRTPAEQARYDQFLADRQARRAQQEAKLNDNARRIEEVQDELRAIDDAQRQRDEWRADPEMAMFVDDDFERKQQAHAGRLREELRSLTSAGWVEADHPRDPEGTSTGGRFTSKSGRVTITNGSQLEQAMANWDGSAEDAAFIIQRAYDLSLQDKLPDAWRNKKVDPAVVMGLGPPDRAEAMAMQRDAPDPEQQQQIEQRLKEFLDEADLNMRVPEGAMMEIFQDGEIMNQHEHGEGSRGMQRDAKSEASMLGMPNFETVTAADLPKYAYLGPDTAGVNMYGPIKLHFKDEVKNRATFTVGDSLMTNPLPSAVRNPSWQSAVSSNAGVGDLETINWNDALLNGDLEYMEAQIYGKLTPDDIERVEILDDNYWEDEDPLTGMPMVENIGQMGAVIDELNRRKIPWSTYQPEGDFSGEWA